MPKCLIAYYSQHGTTAQVAERIAEGLRAAQYQVDLHSIKHDQAVSIGDYSLVGIGSPVYFCTMPLNVRSYLDGLPPAQRQAGVRVRPPRLRPGRYQHHDPARPRPKGGQRPGLLQVLRGGSQLHLPEQGVPVLTRSPNN